MLLKFNISCCYILFCANSLFAQNEMDNIFTKAYLSNLLDTTLTNGVYEFSGFKPIYDEDKTFNVKYSQTKRTVKVVQRFLFFKKKKDAIYIKQTPEIHKFYIKKPFEREVSSDVIVKINPKPLILPQNIKELNIVANKDSSYIIRMKIDEYGFSNMNKILQTRKDSHYILVINDKYMTTFNNSAFELYYNEIFLTLRFENFTKLDIEALENELNIN